MTALVVVMKPDALSVLNMGKRKGQNFYADDDD